MAILTASKITNGGVIKSLVVATLAGDKFKNKGNEFLIVKNGSAASVTVTIDSVKNCSYGFDHNLTIVVAVGDEVNIGRFSPIRFNDEEGYVLVAYSAVTSVTVGVLEL